MKIQVRSTTLSIACAEKMSIFYNAGTLKLETAVGSPFDDEQYIARRGKAGKIYDILKREIKGHVKYFVNLNRKKYEAFL